MNHLKKPVWSEVWLWVSLSGLWFALWRHLSHHWSADEQYSFGWLVPPISAFLAWRRWITRPSPGVPSGALAKTFAFTAALLLLPIWVVAQPNPDWRFVSWVFAILVACFTLSLCALGGGRSWAWHWAFPACFVFVAIPWPSAMETAVIQGLTRLVTSFAVEVLNLTGTVAVQRGRLIEVGAGTLGVDEACSGIRSLQAALMVSFFLGEMLRLGLRPRALLVIAGACTAFAGNVVRATFLAHTAARSGLSSVDLVHDSAGYGILTACLIVTWLLGVWLAPRHEPTRDEGSGHWPHPLSRALSCTFAIWLGVVILATEWWFGGKSAHSGEQFDLTPPVDAVAVAEIPIAPVAVQMLRYDNHRAVSWREPTGERWVAYNFRWDAGPARSRILARMHRPDTCLTATGHVLTADRGEALFEVGGVKLPFHLYVFGSGPGTIHVYYGLWENHSSGLVAHPAGESPITASLRAVWRRERHLAQQVVEIALFDFPTAADADEALRRRLPEILHAEPGAKN